MQPRERQRHLSRGQRMLSNFGPQMHEFIHHMIHLIGQGSNLGLVISMQLLQLCQPPPELTCLSLRLLRGSRQSPGLYINQFHRPFNLLVGPQWRQGMEKGTS